MLCFAWILNTIPGCEVYMQHEYDERHLVHTVLRTVKFAAAEVRALGFRL